ncbi:DUF6011 domain-containing protein [Streptomyces sp. NPDC096310]|uniref:DUF6011 domain-containing protein n=1 Tax=Streptomyces sp. NPDC096310 TaxID=3366082 RepID=UPI0037F28EA9
MARPVTPTVPCRMCGRPLRSQWAARRIGPVCQRKLAGTPRRIPTPRPEHHVPGQDELPLVHLQPTLWSL